MHYFDSHYHHGAKWKLAVLHVYVNLSNPEVIMTLKREMDSAERYEQDDIFFKMERRHYPK